MGPDGASDADDDDDEAAVADDEEDDADAGEASVALGVVAAAAAGAARGSARGAAGGAGGVDGAVTEAEWCGACGLGSAEVEIARVWWWCGGVACSPGAGAATGRMSLLESVLTTT